jgi:RNA polymerase sigma factor (sigma-70 family)
MRSRTRVGFDAGLVAAARAGDPHALADLVAACLPLVYNIVGRALHSQPDVDDVAQEALLRVVRHLPELRDVHAFRSWLVAITVHEIRDFQAQHSAARYRRIDLDEAEDLPDPDSDFAGMTALRLGLVDQRREVAEATRWLNGDDQELLALWWLEETGELSRTDLAGALSLSGRHTAVRVQRMKEQLQIARTVVRALQARPVCAELREIAHTWDGTPSPLWRKRFARHLRDCRRCQRTGAAMVPVDRLLAGASMLPVPPSLSAAVTHSLAAAAPAPAATAAALSAGTAPTGTASTGAVSAGAVGVAAGHGGLMSLPAMIGAATATVAVLVGGYLAVTHHDPAKPVARAASSPSAAVVPVSPPAPSPSALSPSAVPAAPPAAPSPTPAPAKKGVAVWSFTGVSSALAQSGATWYYTWSTTHSGITTPKGATFVPMIRAAADVTPANLASAKAAGQYLLGFNEPDLSSQANMTVDQALDLWPQLVSAGKTLGSPSVAYGADTPGGWLDRFMAGAKSRGHRVDFITLHWYGGDFVTTEAVSQLRSYLQSVYNRYHLPIWLTEYALIDFSNGTRFPTQDQQAAFVTASATMLNSLSYVQRYAWFGLQSSDDAQSGLFRAGPQITTVGKAFQASG